jgi:hypothetical protein
VGVIVVTSFVGIDVVATAGTGAAAAGGVSTLSITCTVPSPKSISALMTVATSFNVTPPVSSDTCTDIELPFIVTNSPLDKLELEYFPDTTWYSTMSCIPSPSVPSPLDKNSDMAASFGAACVYVCICVGLRKEG